MSDRVPPPEDRPTQRLPADDERRLYASQDPGASSRDERTVYPPQDDSAYGTHGAGPAPRARGNGPAVAALVCGLVTLVCGLLSFLFLPILLALPLGIAAIILGVIGLRKARDPLVTGRGMAIAGLLTGLAGLVLSGLFIATIAQFFNDPENRAELQRLREEIEQRGDELGEELDN